MNIPNSSKKVDEKEEIDEVLDEIYAFFDTIKLKRIWKKNIQILSVMEFLPNKRNKNDDVFFMSYMLPSKKIEMLSSRP